ncbi:hypothetical protein ABZX65_26660 [Streptomyces sp. NPDC003300]|uniref:hypothetical protein n=1 Tax=unclassified Streptomyces TaxID=2593676 RepID=UPI0033B49503
MTASRGKRAATAERRTKLINARLEGRLFEDIWEELGYSSRSAATKDFCRAFEIRLTEQRTSVEVYREVELTRLDQLTLEAINVLRTQHYAITPSGKIGRHPDTEEVLIDDGPTLAAIDRLLKIQDRRAKLLGLDKPLKVQMLTMDQVDAEIERLSAELNGAPPIQEEPVD